MCTLLTVLHTIDAHIQCAITQGYLSGYPHTLEEDNAALTSNQLPPFSDQRHAVIQVTRQR
jgi:hypothetical protein